MEKILFSNAFNQTEYLRTLAKLGKNTFGLRVMSDVELCFYILDHYQKMPDGDFISSSEEDYIYFAELQCGDYHDAKNLRMAIDSYRDLVKDDVLGSIDQNLSNDFLEKKNLIKNKYQEYQAYKAKNHLYDKNDLILFVINFGIKLDIECFYYEEYGITQTFLELLKIVFSKVESRSLLDDFPKNDKSIHFKKAYGKSCEADYIFSEIQKYPLDECQIVLTSSEDALEVYKTAEMLNIPYSSSLGIPVISTNAGIILSYLFKLKDMSYGVDGYRALFGCTAFDESILKSMIPPTAYNPDHYFNDFIKYVGWLRLDFTSKVSDIPQALYEPEMAAMLTKIVESLEKGRAGFIRDFLVQPISQDDENVLSSIEALEKAAKRYHFKEEDIETVLLDLLQGSINHKVSQSGHLFITNVNSAISSLRKHTFIVGLDSAFPGGPKENYLIFDDEYLKTGSSFYDSKEIVKRKEKVLRTLIDGGEDVYLTYPYFELASLEDNNPSSVFFDLYGSDIANCPTHGFDDLKLVVNKEIYQARLRNKVFAMTPCFPALVYQPDKLLNKTYSPSQFHAYFEEENRLSFLLSVILGIDIADEDDPYRIISSNDRGTLIHDLMEGFQKDQISWIDFLKKAKEAFDKFILMKPAVIKSSIAQEKEEYLRLIKNVYDGDPGNTFVAAEKYVIGQIADISFGGRYDRIEKNKFGKYILVDYKTGRSVIHKNDDVVSCIQGLIYGYLINHDKNYIKQGINISRVEFRYPDSDVIIHINYNPAFEQELINKVTEFKNAIEQGLLFDGVDLKNQKFVDKYAHLISLFERMN